MNNSAKRVVRKAADRRQPAATAASPSAPDWVVPSWPEQRLQFLTRYLFGILGVIYFNLVFEYNSPWLSLGQLNILLGLYFLWLTVSFVHAYFQRASRLRVRLTMWVDIVMISVALVNDPFTVPLVSLVYIVVVLGNGMRYGMRLFSEALVGSLLAAMVALSLRYSGSVYELTPGVVFLNIFGAIILLYAYVLMSRVDATRRMMEHSSRVDPLTGLMNRNALEETADALLREAAETGRPVAVLFADLDRFKAVNDTFGHNEGDRVLREVAAIIRNAVRDGDAAARYGGDEFVLLLRGTSREEARPVARRIQRELTRWAEDNALDIGVSIGIGEAPAHGASLPVLLDRVDRALYRCKLAEGGTLNLAMLED